MKEETLMSVASLHLEKSERFGGYTQLVATTDEGEEYIISGDYCGGVPVSSWRKVDNR